MAAQSVGFNFSQGLNTKQDPWQVPLGQFENLENMIFQTGGLLQKRPGYGALSSLSPNNYFLTTFNGNLTAIANTVSAYSSSLETWITKGTLQPCSLNVLPLIRNNLNQTYADSAVANGLVCTTYTETYETTSAVVTKYMYVIADVVTGQNIVEPTDVPPLSTGTITGSSRVFVVGNYFVIVSQVLVSSNTHLQYVSIPTTNPVNIVTNTPNTSTPQNVTTEVYVPTTSNPGWDGIAVNNSSNNELVVAYNTTSGGQGVHVALLTVQQIVINDPTSTIVTFDNAAYIGAIVSVCVDVSVNPPVYYISFWNNSTSNGYTCAVTTGFNSISTQFTPQEIISDVAVVNLASAAQNNSCLVFSEVTNAYSYDATIPTNFIDAVTVSSAGVVGTPYVAARSIGLASKAFIVGGTVYFLGAFQSEFQPSYFLMNGSLTTAVAPIIVSMLANLNGGGYLTLGLPNVTIINGVAQLPYLFKDDVEALNTLNNPTQTTAGGIYSQTGINLVSFIVATKGIDTAEIANNLFISGGYLSQYDGYLPFENNFFVWPDSVELTYTEVSTVTPSGTTTTGSNIITALSSNAGIAPGMTITGTGIPAGTSIVLVGSTTLTLSAVATGNHSAETLTIQGNIAAVPTGAPEAGNGLYYYQVTYEFTDNQGLAYRSTPSIPVTYTTVGSGTTGTVTVNVPTLRLTAKISNPVKIVIYRYSIATGAYNQVTSITAPVLNNTTVDSVSFVDTLPDADVVGNNILYTTGGVLPDSAAPSTSIMTLFDTRLWMVSAEDPHTLWLSKTVVEGSPVEMSQDFTIYVAPTAGTIGSLGPITGLFPMDDKLIIFFKEGIYYINGTGPNDLGTTQVGCSLGQYSQPTFITTVVGCNNQQSIVLTEDGLMFQSDKGIWLLGRNLQVSYIGAPVEAYNGSIVNSANLIPGTTYVLFTLNTNQMLMYDYFYSQWGTFTGTYAISSCIYNDLHTIIDTYGRILQQTPGQYLDASSAVLMSFTTSWLNLASLQGYQRFYDFYILAKYLSPHSLLCQVAYDYNPSIQNQRLITPGNFSPSTPGPFGIPTPFGSPGNKEQWRVHSKVQLCESFQLTITEVFNSAYGVTPGAGFTMSGITCNIDIKKNVRPIRGSNAAGMS